MTQKDQMDDILDMLESMPEVDKHESEFVIAEQKFQENVRADIEWLMEHKNVSRRELADTLGISAPAVSKMLNKPNLTLKTIARIFKALGEECVLNCPTLEFLRVSAKLQRSPARASMKVRTGDDINVCEIHHIEDVRKQRNRRWHSKGNEELSCETQFGAMIVNGWK